MVDRDRKVSLALEVLDVVRCELLLRYPYFEAVLFAMEFKDSGELESPLDFGTDGRFIYFDPDFVLNSYRKGKPDLHQVFLHSLIHCLFHHLKADGVEDRESWDLAADVSVFCVLSELGIVNSNKWLENLKMQIPFFSIRNIYNFLALQKMSRANAWYSVERVCDRLDDHSLWYSAGGQAGDSSGQSAGTALADRWKNLAENFLASVQTSGCLGRGSEPGFLSEYLKSVVQDEVDYSKFLQNFSVIKECVQVNQDEFDLGFYNYGIELYERVPIIEPLEYKEKRAITNFVIVIDTSGSIDSDEMRRFLTKTYSILKSSESFDRKVNVHIIQCDADVTKDVKITSQADLEEYVSAGIRVYGRGGTDFRPAFRYVKSLLESGELQCLDGLLYFTDGYGVFPETDPGFKTAFVLSAGCEVEVPPWAMRVVFED